jgi:hypothetical protein
MKSINLTGTMGKALLVFSLLFGIGIMSSMTAQAQYQNDSYGSGQNRRDRDRDWRRDRDRDGDRNGRSNDGYGNYGGSFELRQTALNAGANEGNKAGRDDRNHNRRADPQSHSEYQKGTKDYSSRLGDRYIYQRYFREAYIHGYRDGYAGY